MFGVSGAGRRIRVGVLVGGASGEREISLASGRMIVEHLPRDRYDVVLFDTLALMAGNPALPAGLARQAKRLLQGGAPPAAPGDAAAPELPPDMQSEIEKAVDAAVPGTEVMRVTEGDRRIDVAFIALHGRYGEDGTLQGMLELLGIPYVGSGVLASALAIDKGMAKKVLAAEGIPVPRGMVIDRSDLDEGCAGRAEAFVPGVVKPCREGSSLGVSLVRAAQDLPGALETAFAHDTRVLVEERLEGREITVGIIGNRRLTPLPVVEIASRRSFFDFRAKYDPAFCDEICPADLPPAVTEAAQGIALRAHRALDCRGLSRVDMIVTDDRGPVVLEVNTIPGMTVNSLLPKAARAAGIPFGDLLDRLVRLALGEE